MVNFHLYKKGCLKSFESELIEKASDVVLKVDLPHSQLLCYLYQLHWIRALRWEWSYSEKLNRIIFFSHISFIDKSTTCILRYSSTPIPDLNIRFWRQENFSHGYSLPDLITIKSGETWCTMDLARSCGNYRGLPLCAHIEPCSSQPWADEITGCSIDSQFRGWYDLDGGRPVDV